MSDSPRPLALHFGAGAIGRGFLAQLYSESGFETALVDIREDVVEALGEGRYPIEIAVDPRYRLWIENVRGILASDERASLEAFRSARIASTAVGARALPSLAPLFAKGILARFSNPGAEPLDVILAENLMDAASLFREEIARHLGENRSLLAKVGLVEASIGRMAPVWRPGPEAHPLAVRVEAYNELPVDAAAFIGEIPAIRNLKPFANFSAVVERKLFVHNAGHAATAYLGALRGHTAIASAIRDGEVAGRVAALMSETCLALHRKHKISIRELELHARDLLSRFDNDALGDTVLRVGADPLRKLGPNDRLVGALHLCIAHGVKPVHVGMALAAATRYDDPNDPSARTLAEIRAGGDERVLEEVCQLIRGSDAWHWAKRGLDSLRSFPGR